MPEEEYLSAEEMRDLFTGIKEGMEALNEKVDDLISGASSAHTQLTGSIIENDAVRTQLTGSNMEYYGAAIGDRPNANAVPKGATFTIVDNNLDQNWISNGTNWVEV